jgi:hypothetical protein
MLSKLNNPRRLQPPTHGRARRGAAYPLAPRDPARETVADCHSASGGGSGKRREDADKAAAVPLTVARARARAVRATPPPASRRFQNLLLPPSSRPPPPPAHPGRAPVHRPPPSHRPHRRPHPPQAARPGSPRPRVPSLSIYSSSVGLFNFLASADAGVWWGRSWTRWRRRGDVCVVVGRSTPSS